MLKSPLQRWRRLNTLFRRASSHCQKNHSRQSQRNGLPLQESGIPCKTQALLVKERKSTRKTEVPKEDVPSAASLMQEEYYGIAVSPLGCTRAPYHVNMFTIFLLPYCCSGATNKYCHSWTMYNHIFGDIAHFSPAKVSVFLYT